MGSRDPWVRPGFLVALALPAALAVPSTALGGGGGGEPGERAMAVCHVPPGNTDARHTIEVGEPALDAHLDHGDWVGACGPSLWRSRSDGRRGREGRGREREKAREESKREREKAREESKREQEKARGERERERDRAWHEGWRDVLERELSRLRENRDEEFERALAEAGDAGPEEVEIERGHILNRYLEQVRKLQEDYLDGPTRNGS